MTHRMIKCPKCNTRSWSSEYWYCPTCDYYVDAREWVLLEQCKDYLEDDKWKGDEPQLDLNKWTTDQEDLTKEMINECLPKGKYNYEVDCSQDLGTDWGRTEYHENNLLEANLFIGRHEEELIDRGSTKQGFIYYVDGRGNIVKVEPKKYPVYPPYSGVFCCPCVQPTKIKISNRTLQTEGSYNFDGLGYFPTIPHEAAHADPSVHRHPNYKPFSSQYDPSGTGKIGHDDIHRNKNIYLYTKLKAMGYQEKIKDRFKELRKIKKEDDDKYG